MFQAVVVGMAGVVDRPDALRRAEIEAAAAWVERHAGTADGFRAAANPARSDWLARALPAAGLASDRQVLRQIWSAVQGAVPVAESAAVRNWLQPLRGSARLAVLDTGTGQRMDQWLDRLGISDWFERRLWTSDLGRDARPPRPLAFRWIASRLDVPARDCLYVAGRNELATAARQAGWSVLRLPRPLDPELDWDAVVAGRSPGVC
jgi:FMN phosphatase YigB (HAD superfamily)